MRVATHGADLRTAVLVLGSGAAVLDVRAGAAPSFRLAGCLLLPFAVLAYPRLGWRDPVSFVLAVLLAGAGSLSVVLGGCAGPDGVRDHRRATGPSLVGVRAER